MPCGANYYVFAEVSLTSPPPTDPTPANNYDRTNSTFPYGCAGGLKVGVPNGGECWQRDTTQVIRWAPGSVGPRAHLALHRGNPARYVMTIQRNATNDGFLRWTIPATLPPHYGYKVKVVSASDKTIYDFSDPYLGATAPARPALVDFAEEVARALDAQAEPLEVP